MKVLKESKMREELIKLIKKYVGYEEFGDMELTADRDGLADALLKDFLVLRKSEVRVIDVGKDNCERDIFNAYSVCPVRSHSCGASWCGISQVIVISKEK